MLSILNAARTYRDTALSALQARLQANSIDREQRAAHGFAWIATSVAALEAVHGWSERNGDGNRSDTLVARLAFAETLGQLVGGLPMGQNELFRPADLGLSAAARTLHEAARDLLDEDHAATRAELAQALGEGQWPSESFGDADLDAIRDQFRKFTDAEIIPHAHKWHLANELIPDSLVRSMADLGTFGVCIPEEFGGLGMGKLVMCLVTEELSRGWIGTGSLGTRSEIAGELIVLGGTDEQKAHWLPLIASGEILPTAVFTEPDTGSDLGSLQTRAQRDPHLGWTITGAKTWITHASRSDLMTLLARTLPDEKGYSGLSMLLVPKPRGTDADLFPAPGLTGSEIEVLGYRGMREYALQFDGMQAPADALLGGAEGQGFKQLMRTFEGARIQTAARAVGVARRALELGLAYALDRKQFGRAIVGFPRVADKLAMSLVDYVITRELTYDAARAKDSGKRCDIEAGMAKLLAARTAWSNADAALQIHGGNGYSLEYEISRVLCDARILNIFEGAAEIQAQVIARGLAKPRG
ncbi:Isobutyryl-CoA dehydrogenase [Sphingobium herbicidovorans NBRC 16415]|uniref:Isobutyryl-CoA dehydrogenase n=1 Tax=Sphingobium herbicidovorans (strain ATCC 700291 / DSM 11019 / CCUG 56400 / KCTC 2939 / LMG 18315 / NBRC 16415 / MH) TaxID=1219045 RepID=A0A086PBX5_SPHHM|nr:acyl-CoA dehydrogenase family protein [Sphingobium herbicidovorans]KFG90893.1 Isobutyryl-CoA dehydrogenase [Sphingobium herbicidovorans NBRC 16415]